MLIVVSPIPEPINLDLSTTIDLILDLFFNFAPTLLLVNVAINLAEPLLVDNPLNFIIDPPELLYVTASNLSSVKTSVNPLSVVNTYLSSSNERNLSF